MLPGTTIDALLDQVAARTAAPGAGTVTCVVTGLAAALTAMVARYADDVQLAGRAESISARALALGEQDGVAYGRYLAGRDPQDRRRLLDLATAVQSETAQLAADVSEIVGPLVGAVRPALTSDAATAALLCSAAAQCAATLVAANVPDEDDSRRVECDRQVARAAAAVRQTVPGGSDRPPHAAD